MNRLNKRYNMLFLPCIIGLVTAASLAQVETDYLAIMLENQKVGYAVHTRTVADDKVTTTDHIEMTLGRGGQALKIIMEETHLETTDGKPLGFELAQTISGIEQKTICKVTDGKAVITRQVLGQSTEQTVDWPADAVLNEGLRLFQLKRGLKTGDVFDVRVFRPDMLMSLTAQVRVGEKTKVDLFGRLLDLTEVELTMQVAGQSIVMTSYVDEQMKALKTRAPMMNMVLEMLACDRSFAMRQDDIVDFLDKLSIASPITLINLNTIESITYTLKPTGSAPLVLPVSSSQAVEKTPDRIQVTVTKTEPAGPIAFPYKGDAPEALESLKPTDYLQCNNEKIIELARQAVGDANDAVVAVGRIEAFVDEYIKQKDLSVGYASAAEVAQTRQGDCSEHAVLSAAMCRAVGIPARTVCGVVYADTFLSKQNIFGGHMWTEVYLGNTWFGLDATRSEQHGFGPGHLALAYGNGDPVDFFGLVNTLGCFEIEKITVNKTRDTADNPLNP